MQGMQGLKVVIIGGGGNTAEVTGAMLTLKGCKVQFYRFPRHIYVPGTPKRPERSFARLTSYQVVGSSKFKDYSFKGKALYTDIDGIHKADIIIIALPAYLMELLPTLLPHVFGGKVVISLCERFLNTAVFLRSLREHGFEDPKFMISHRSDPFDANKVSKDGINRLWRVKTNNDYHISDKRYLTEAKNLMAYIYGPHSQKWGAVESLWDLAFQNLNAISHAVIDFEAVTQRKYELGNAHYTAKSYTAAGVNYIQAIVSERDKLTSLILNKVYPSLAEHEKKSYGASGMEELLGTSQFRLENSILANRPAPELYRASGFEDIGWSIVPLEEVARHFNIPMPYTGALIDKWSAHFATDYRKVGRKVGSLVYTLPSQNIYRKI